MNILKKLKIKLHYPYLFVIFVLIILIIIGLSFFFSKYSSQLDISDWLQFIGTATGAFLSTLTAVICIRITNDSNRKQQIKQQEYSIMPSLEISTDLSKYDNNDLKIKEFNPSLDDFDERGLPKPCYFYYTIQIKLKNIGLASLVDLMLYLNGILLEFQPNFLSKDESLLYKLTIPQYIVGNLESATLSIEYKSTTLITTYRQDILFKQYKPTPYEIHQEELYMKEYHNEFDEAEPTYCNLYLTNIGTQKIVNQTL